MAQLVKIKKMAIVRIASAPMREVNFRKEIHDMKRPSVVFFLLLLSVAMVAGTLRVHGATSSRSRLTASFRFSGGPAGRWCSIPPNAGRCCRRFWIG